MDPQKVQEIVSLKMNNIFLQIPPRVRDVLKRAESYQVISEANHTTALYPLHYNILKYMLKCLWQCVPIDGVLHNQYHRKQDKQQHCLAKVVLTPQEAMMSLWSIIPVPLGLTVESKKPRYRATILLAWDEGRHHIMGECIIIGPI